MLSFTCIFIRKKNLSKDKFHDPFALYSLEVMVMEEEKKKNYIHHNTATT